MFGLYIHIPFCLKKCAYCDFNSRPARSGEVDEYLSALIQEIRTFSKENRRLVETVYLGGGTPTLLSEEQLSRLFDALRCSLTLVEDAEVSVEANPGTMDRRKAEQMLRLGVNRVSLGVQSLKDSILARLGRVHTAAQALETMAMFRDAGFENLGVDLIYGLPGQSEKDWDQDLMRIFDLRPEHLSLYALSIEKGTPLHQAQEQGRLELPSEEEQVRMFQSARDLTADAGYEHYEISNFARPGYRCRHNTVYWSMEEYYGAGAGAHSFFYTDGPCRWANVSDPAEYLVRMKGSGSPVSKREYLSKRIHLGEAMMLGLRMIDGVKIAEFQSRYGADPLAFFSEALGKARDRRWVAVTQERIRLTADGILFSNEVFAELF